MSKTINLFALLFSAVAAVAGIIHFWFWSRMGPEVTTMQSYLSWSTLLGASALIGFLFSLRYFFMRGWKYVFAFGSLALVLAISLAIFEYFALVNTHSKPQPLQSAALISYRICMTILGIAILLASPKQEKSLRWFAILIVITSCSMLVLSFPGAIGVTPQTAYDLFLAIYPLAIVIWLLLIRVFALKLREERFPKKFTGSQRILILAASVVSAILVAWQIQAASGVAREMQWSAYWKKQGPERNRTLALMFEERNFVSKTGDTLHYFLMKPSNYDSTQLYPMVTCLQGGAIATGESVEIHEPAPFLIDSVNRKKFPAFIFVPQVTAGHTWGGAPGVPGMDSMVFEAITALEVEFSLDTDRCYLAGVSGGAFGTWDYLSKRPNMFAAALPISGRGNPAVAARISHIPVWAFHGSADRNVAVSGSREMIAALTAAGGNPKYSEFADAGHNVWAEIRNTPGVFEWLFAQRRKQ